MKHHVIESMRTIVESDVPDSDVVVATWWETANWVNALSPRKGAKAYFIQHHEVFPYLPIDQVEATYRLPSLHRFTISRWLHDIMRDKYGDAETALVPNSVDTDLFFAPPRGSKSARQSASSM